MMCAESIYHSFTVRRTSHGKVQCRPCATHMCSFVLGVSAWVVGRGKYFTQNIMRIAAETPTINAYVVSYRCNISLSF